MSKQMHDRPNKNAAALKILAARGIKGGDAGGRATDASPVALDVVCCRGPWHNVTLACWRIYSELAGTPADADVALLCSAG